MLNIVTKLIKCVFANKIRNREAEIYYIGSMHAYREVHKIIEMCAYLCFECTGIVHVYHGVHNKSDVLCE